jgi:hypothetical protein
MPGCCRLLVQVPGGYCTVAFLDQHGLGRNGPEPLPVMDLKDTGSQVRYLIRDRDGKYPAQFDAILADGARIPRMNAIMQRRVRTGRHELLDRTLIPNHRHLLHALRQYEMFLTNTARTRESPTPGRWPRRPHRSPTQTGSPDSTSVDATASAVHSTNTIMVPELRGRTFGRYSAHRGSSARGVLTPWLRLIFSDGQRFLSTNSPT